MAISKYNCPHCGSQLVALMEFVNYIYTDEYRCKRCAALGNVKFIYTGDELVKGVTKSMKEILFKKTYNDTIVELEFSKSFSKSHWADNVIPAINILKALIPATSREWDSNTKKWSLDIQYWGALQNVYKELNWQFREVVAGSNESGIPNVHVPEDYAQNFHYKQEVIAQKESTESIAKQLSVFLGVEITTQDLNDLKKLYRKRALELHPDRGGDASKMSELNRLWTLYCNTGVAQ